MQIARAQLGGATSVAVIFGVSVFVLASLVSVVDAHDPVTQSTRPEMTSSATRAKVEPKSTSSLDGLSKDKEKRRAKAFQSQRDIVVDFLGQHFPELQKSLLKSEKKSPVRFRNAVSRLEADVIRLRNIEQKKPAKFELMVDLWKLKTQAEMTIAKYARKESDSQLEERLSPLLDQMLDIRKSVFELERQSAVNKVSKIDKRLLHIENDRARIIENNLRSFQKSADKIRGKQKRKSVQRQSLNSNPSTGSQPTEERPN